MAITDTKQAKDFTAGAPKITLEGDLRPNQMMAGSSRYQIILDELINEMEDALGRPITNDEYDQLGREAYEKLYESSISTEQNQMMASEPGIMDERNELSLRLFGKELKLLTPEEMDILDEEADRLMQKFMADGGRAQYGLGSFVKSIGKAVKGVVKGVGKGITGAVKGVTGAVKDNPLLALAALNFAPMLIPGGKPIIGLSNLSLPGFLSPTTEGGKFLRNFAIGTLATGALTAAEAGGLDTSDPNAEVDIESLKGYLSRGYKNLNPNATDEEVFQFVQENTAEYRANGGRIGYAMGTDDKVKMAAGIEGLPININSKGIKELDLRETGGFIPPVGVKEKADDIPAMLSNNEFVFTADAVRAAGGGDVNKGAEIMYDTMKKLERRIA